MRIGIDAMGGDHAPEEIVLGGVLGLKFLGPDDRLVLIGREDNIRSHLPTDVDPRIEIVHTPEVIEMDDSPVESLRQKRKSSIVVMARMAAQGELDAVISAGNTGACAAACQLQMKSLGPVLRPGIAVVLPTFAGPLTICDAGANVQPKPQHLLQYAQMACAYASEILGIKNPRVGLISVGGEDVKGSPLVKKTNELLRADPTIDFVGNVEGRELFSGACEVGVCDGFVGNVVLKLTEGLAEGLFRTIRREVTAESEDLGRRIEPIFGRIWQKHDYSEYGGAPLLGVNGSCIICHGSSERRAIYNAVRISADFVRKNLNSIILSRLSEVSPDA
ncbi:MAG TPA: phosphate acyltransferase PlsX [Phycisphaerae bacterium]|nr:phosphate acyltransferase PlsX [Phycisphaerae bacterium]HRW51276.1 phosphate acyltransferase PlsX [Phycisphaerae bacterium]